VAAPAISASQRVELPRNLFDLVADRRVPWFLRELPE
jgi:hypothetical protein